MSDSNTFVIGPVRLSFPALFEPKPVSQEKDADLMYQMVALLPPDFDMASLRAKMVAAVKAKWGQPPKGLKNPIRDAAEKRESTERDLAGFDDGWHFINIKSQFPPTVVDQSVQPVLDQSKAYPGCWVNVEIDVYAWDNKFGKGVSFGLHKVQVCKDDERLDSQTTAAEVFEPIAVAGDDGAAAADTGDGGDADDFFA